VRVGGQDVVKGYVKVTTAGLKLCEEESLVDGADNDTEDTAIVIVLDDTGVIVAPHVHENADACVQDIVVASESNGTAPGGNVRSRDGVDGCEEDTVESCNDVDGNLSEDDARDVEEHVVDNGVGYGTSDDDEDDRVDKTRETGGS
jgi:hypothetical protein